jgi:hypothetical protein
VQTFPAQTDFRHPNTTGIAPPGVDVKEVRADMASLAQGLAGYNVPSLIGGAYSAPYFHAGNARTLEEAFSDTFQGHYGAFLQMGQTFPGGGANREVAIRQLVAFLLSIDASLGSPGNPPMNTLLCPLMFGTM